jgi:hypothetical protein
VVPTLWGVTAVGYVDIVENRLILDILFHLNKL